VSFLRLLFTHLIDGRDVEFCESGLLTVNSTEHSRSASPFAKKDSRTPPGPPRIDS